MATQRKVIFYRTQTMQDLKESEQEKEHMENSGWTLIETVHGFDNGFFVWERE